MRLSIAMTSLRMASRGSFRSSAMACWTVDFNWSISEGMVGSSGTVGSSPSSRTGVSGWKSSATNSKPVTKLCMRKEARTPRWMSRSIAWC